MQYLMGRQWVNGVPYGEPANLPISGLPDDALLESVEDRPEDLEGCPLDACECFCEEFCRQFCPAFCRDFCSDVRDEVCETKRLKRCGRKIAIRREKKSRVSAGKVANPDVFCCRRREGCQEVACRTCQRVFLELGRVCPSNFCRCFAEDFCCEFGREFERIRRRLGECHHGRIAICGEGCREICCRICPCVCRRHCCQVPLI